MKQQLILFIIIVCTTNLIGQAQKIFVKSFANPAPIITISVNGSTQIKEWDQPFIRVLTTVTIKNSNNNVLTALAQAGRYQLKTKHTENKQQIYSPSNFDPIKFQGKQLTEQISFIIYVPNFSEVIVNENEKNLQKNSL